MIDPRLRKDNLSFVAIPSYGLERETLYLLAGPFKDHLYLQSFWGKVIGNEFYLYAKRRSGKVRTLCKRRKLGLSKR
jgi:hypothetical protein